MRGIVCAVLGLVMLTGMPTVARSESTEQRLRSLEKALKDAQDEIRRLKDEVRQQRAVSQGTQQQIEAQRAAQEEQSKKMVTADKLPDFLKRISIFGDLRMRHEGFYHQPARDGTVVTARNRERFRARVGIKATFSDELSTTVRIASGNPDDPISTNETADREFTPKHVNLDWAFLTFTPGTTFGIRPGLITTNLGKFPNPIYRPGEMVFDDDISFEGASQTLSVLSQPYGLLDSLKVHAVEATFAEVSNAEDGWLIGGQVNPSFRADPLTVDVGIGQFYYLNDDLIAQALNTNSSLKNTHDTFTVMSNGKTLIGGFVSSFNLTDASMGITLANAVHGMPLRFFGDYVHNSGAENGDDNGYFGGFKLGQAKARGDWTVGAFYEHLEKDAALSVYSNSDFGLGGTNNEGPVVTLEYQLLDPLTLSARNYFVNFIDRPAGLSNPTLFRLQLDALVKF